MTITITKVVFISKQTEDSPFLPFFCCHILLIKMDSEYSDTKKMYEVKELEEYETNDDSRFNNVKLDDIAKKPQSMWKIPIVIGLLLLSVVLLLIVILQSVTIAHLNLLPVVCPEETATASPVTDALTGAQDEINMQLLSQMSQLINMSKDIMSTGNQLVYTSQSILSVSDEQLTYLQNNTDWLNQILETSQDSAQRLYEIRNALSIIKDTNIATEVVVNDIFMIVEELLRIQNGSLIYSSHLPISCQDIKDKQPESPSGYYHINSELVYCEMGELCNSTEGGWTRLAFLDMTDSFTYCPEDFMLDETAGIRSCGRSSGGAGCSSVMFPSNGISYSEVCGRVVGYQYGTTEAVFASIETIDSHYVDGLSITQGSPRKHVWTLMAGRQDSFGLAKFNCPCNTPPGTQPPPFVGNDYFCESGNPNSNNPSKLHTADPLWDGEGCGTLEGDCCAAAGLPWFYRTLNTTTDYIELRDCGSFTTANENVFVSSYEIYVK